MDDAYKPVRVPWHEELTFRGLRHHVTWWGERTETPVVLLHGFMDCGATWQFLADCLPSGWSLAAPDWRGFGRTDWASDGYWFPDYFADLEILLDFLVPHGPARVIGHSMGANIAMMYGGIRPQRLAWLINLEGFGLPPTNPQDAPARYVKWLDELREPRRQNRYRSVSQLAEFLRTRNPRLPPERAELIAQAWTHPVAANPSDSGGEQEGGEVELLFDPRHRAVNPVLYRRQEAEACWARIAAPVLLMCGEAEDGRSGARQEVSGEMNRHVRNMQVVTVPGAGHMLHHEKPGEVARHIAEFERRVR